MSSPELVPDHPLSTHRFEILYEKHVNGLYTYLNRRIGPDLAEELTAQSFAEAWAGRDRFDPERGAFSSWLYGIALNLLRRHRRTEAARLRAFGRIGIDPPATIDESAVVGRIAAVDGWPAVALALTQLDDQDRDIVTLFVWERFSYDQISVALDIPVGTVKSRMSRARTRIAVQLAQPPEQDGQAS